MNPLTDLLTRNVHTLSDHQLLHLTLTSGAVTGKTHSAIEAARLLGEPETRVRNSDTHKEVQRNLIR